MDTNEDDSTGKDGLVSASLEQSLEKITYTRLLKIPRVALGIVGNCVSIFSFVYMEPILSFVWETHKLSKSVIGAAWILIPVGMLVGFVLSSFLAKRVGKRAVIIVAALLISLAYILFGPSQVLPLPEDRVVLHSLKLRFFLVMFLCVAFINFVARLMPYMIEGAMEALPCEDEAERKATLTRVTSLLAGLSGSAKGIGMVLAPVISAELYDRYGLGVSCDFSAFVHFIFALVFVICGDGPFLKQSQQPEEKLATEDEEEQEMLLPTGETPRPTADTGAKKDC